ncbi:hypothetical protein Trydic_g22328 [Trypoxylus dichotomus]
MSGCRFYDFSPEQMTSCMREWRRINVNLLIGTEKTRCLQNVGLATSKPEFECGQTCMGYFGQSEMQKIANKCKPSI